MALGNRLILRRQYDLAAPGPAATTPTPTPTLAAFADIRRRDQW